HWLQPLTYGTAVKHDSFLAAAGNGRAIMAFSGENLVLGESDASSFPSGGIRTMFEARGYTAWDPTSPAFIKRHPNGATLCIPTAFCSFRGEVLDKKTPLLRSIQALKASITRLMNCFGVPEATPVISLGAEQEYFLIDKAFYMQRPDLVQTGRTLFGAPPAKHQQLEDHYFGSIKPRILSFMTEVEEELWRLGIPAKTRHNEVAPAQYEIAPIYEELNLAVDHNMLVMETLRQVADRNGLVCLLHEKPFHGLNGSGKHNNWSIAYGKRHLLDPGSDPEQNMIFLTVLSSIIRGVDLHSDLLRTTTCSIGNDLRLGGNEAPPSIISIFLGDELDGIIDQIVREGTPSGRKKQGTLRVGVNTLPPLPVDGTDRNRTSPMAFTGNKFEFRAPGSSFSCAAVNTFLNTIVADSLDYISEKLEKASGKDFQKTVQSVIRDVFTKHRRIIFNGNGYSDEWAEEAKKRGLPNLKFTPESLKPLLDPDNQDLVAKYSVFSKVEMDSRYEVFLDDYRRRLRIEGEVALEIARTMMIPLSQNNLGRLTAIMNSVAATGIKDGLGYIRESVRAAGKRLDDLTLACEALEEAIVAEDYEAIIYGMEKLRVAVDELERETDDAEWPMPKYREMLFIY
ncbi:MAG: glutamine synthetase type III, partial [Lentisphaerae bacterium]|nr:glutamine synthetase type III [Lentisphaerota bacterium]